MAVLRGFLFHPWSRLWVAMVVALLDVTLMLPSGQVSLGGPIDAYEAAVYFDAVLAATVASVAILLIFAVLGKPGRLVSPGDAITEWEATRRKRFIATLAGFGVIGVAEMIKWAIYYTTFVEHFN